MLRMFCYTLPDLSEFGFIKIQNSRLIALLTNNTGFEPESRTLIDRARNVTSPIWSCIDLLAGPKIHIVGLSARNR